MAPHSVCLLLNYLFVGKPGRPGDLLSVEMTFTGLTLLASPPEDSGGSPVISYAVDIKQVITRA